MICRALESGPNERPVSYGVELWIECALVVRILAKTGGRCETRSASDSRWSGIHQPPIQAGLDDTCSAAVRLPHSPRRRATVASMVRPAIKYLTNDTPSRNEIRTICNFTEAVD